MRTRIIRIGNSLGIRIPSSLLEQAGIRNTVQIRAEKGRLVILPDQTARQGWPEAFATITRQGDDRVPLDRIANRFDRDEWTW